MIPDELHVRIRSEEVIDLRTLTVPQIIVTLRALLEGSTKGSWRKCAAHDFNCPCGLIWCEPQDVAVACTYVRGASDIIIRDEEMQANSDFIVGAHELLPALLDHLEHQQDLEQRLMAAEAELLECKELLKQVVNDNSSE